MCRQMCLPCKLEVTREAHEARSRKQARILSLYKVHKLTKKSIAKVQNLTLRSGPLCRICFYARGHSRESTFVHRWALSPLSVISNTGLRMILEATLFKSIGAFSIKEKKFYIL